MSYIEYILSKIRHLPFNCKSESKTYTIEYVVTTKRYIFKMEMMVIKKDKKVIMKMDVNLMDKIIWQIHGRATIWLESRKRKYSIGEQVQRAETVRMLPCHLIVSFRVQADFFAVVFPLRDYHFAENNGRCTQHTQATAAQTWQDACKSKPCWVKKFINIASEGKQCAIISNKASFFIQNTRSHP